MVPGISEYVCLLLHMCKVVAATNSAQETEEQP